MPYIAPRHRSFPPLLNDLRPTRVAVFRALRLGDMVCAVPALRALRKALPDASITLVGLPWAGTLATRLHRYVDEFVAFPGYPGLPEQAPDAAALPAFFTAMRARRFDLAIQMHGDGRISNAIVAQFGAARTSGFHGAGTPATPSFLPYPEHGAEIRRLLRLTGFLGAPPDGEDPEFPLLPADAAEVAAWEAAATLPEEGYVCLHAGARAVERRWPPHCFAAVGDALHRAWGLPVVLTGSQDEGPIVGAVKRAMRTPAIDTAGPISAGALAHILARARLVVCNDTGVSHLAAALRRPSVIVFRASEMGRWAPLDRRRHRPVWDPSGRAVGRVLAHAHTLLAMPPAAPSGRA